MNIPDHISESLETIFWVKLLKFFDAAPGWKNSDPELKKSDPGSRINIPDSQHCYFTDLCVLVEVPEVESARAIHSREEGGMDGRPRHVVHIVTVVLKAVQRLILLHKKELLTNNKSFFQNTVRYPLVICYTVSRIRILKAIQVHVSFIKN
jgi:hypothetical protein